MSNMDYLLLALFLSALASHRALAQDEGIHGASDKVSVDGQARNRYGKGSPSAHIFTHFGKRDARSSIDPIPVAYQAACPPCMVRDLSRLSPVLARASRELTGAPEVDDQFAPQADSYYQWGSSSYDLYPVEELPKVEQPTARIGQQQRPLGVRGRLTHMKLSKSEQDGSDSSVAGEELNEADQTDMNSAFEQQNKLVQTRSPNTMGLNMPSDFSQFLYGHPRSSMGYIYNKKAEPKGPTNSFMHFGR